MSFLRTEGGAQVHVGGASDAGPELGGLFDYRFLFRNWGGSLASGVTNTAMPSATGHPALPLCICGPMGNPSLTCCHRLAGSLECSSTS